MRAVRNSNSSRVVQAFVRIEQFARWQEEKGGVTCECDTAALCQPFQLSAPVVFFFFLISLLPSCATPSFLGRAQQPALWLHSCTTPSFLGRAQRPASGRRRAQHPSRSSMDMGGIQRCVLALIHTLSIALPNHLTHHLTQISSLPPPTHETCVPNDPRRTPPFFPGIEDRTSPISILLHGQALYRSRAHRKDVCLLLHTLFHCPDRPSPSSPNPSLSDLPCFIAYALHRTTPTSLFTSTALYPLAEIEGAIHPRVHGCPEGDPQQRPPQQVPVCCQPENVCSQGDQPDGVRDVLLPGTSSFTPNASHFEGPN